MQAQYEDFISTRLGIGHPWPLGASIETDGVNFAVYSHNATAVLLCIFDAQGKKEIARLPLPGRTQDVFHGHLPGSGAGLVYGLRVEGPWAPQDGHLFNPNKLLLDPYARAITGSFVWREEQFGFRDEDHDLMDTRDNAAWALKACVVKDLFDWDNDAPPRIPLADTVIYEVHVKGFSKLNPAIPEQIRGSYAALAHPVSIAHLRRLGVTALSILPIHHHIDEQRLVRMGLANYWGYNTVNFFCPDPRYASGADGMSVRDEFRNMVRALHAAGIEVLLDVVYNHTAESDALGPHINLRGLDNSSYYRLVGNDRRQYVNDTGCGNTLDIRQPAALRLVMDSLRYWVTEMHVDGFRFDLAPVLGRGDDGFDVHGAFFAVIAQDPVLSRVKMIAEPWDIGPGGYQVGGFPRGWLEWNDKFRDVVRSFWLRRSATRGEFAMRLCGSSDIYQRSGRDPVSSINYVVSHDGFCLRDLVSYNDRHNQANGENNRDGHSHNFSFNCGAEGPSDDAGVNALRERFQRVLLATALLAQGTPMFMAGDELGHTQRGNNNPYCQDNDITWIDWARADEDLVEFTACVLALRRQMLPFDNHWYTGLPDALGAKDLDWRHPDGSPLQGGAWSDAGSHALACLIGRPGRSAAPVLLLMNGDATDRDFVLPAGAWHALLDTTHPRGVARGHGQKEASCRVKAHSMTILAVPDA